MALDSQLLERGGRFLVWSTEPLDRGALKAAGFSELRYEELRACWQRLTSDTPTTLESPAQPLFDDYAQQQRIAIHDLPLKTVGDLRLLYGLLVEPAFRRDCALVIHSAQALEALEPEDYIEPEYG